MPQNPPPPDAPAPSGKSPAPGKGHVQDRADAARIAARAAQLVDRGHGRVREKHPWSQMLSWFLTPDESPDGESVRWPTLRAVAERFGVAESRVKERSAKYAWISQQKKAEDAFWLARNNQIYRQMANRLPQVQGAAFTVAAKVITECVGKLKVPQDAATVAKLSRANAQALDTAMVASGMQPRAIAPATPNVESPVLRLTQTEDVVNLGADGKPVSSGRRQTLLELFQGRQLTPTALPGDEEDSLDRPSPLPTHLSMVR